jgi:hypothetical protein
MPTIPVYLTEDEYFYAEMLGRKKAVSVPRILVIALNNYKPTELNENAQEHEA